jgi:hypothetical protein
MPEAANTWETSKVVAVPQLNCPAHNATEIWILDKSCSPDQQSWQMQAADASKAIKQQSKSFQRATIVVEVKLCA